MCEIAVTAHFLLCQLRSHSHIIVETGAVRVNASCVAAGVNYLYRLSSILALIMEAKSASRYTHLVSPVRFTGPHNGTYTPGLTHCHMLHVNETSPNPRQNATLETLLSRDDFTLTVTGRA